MLKRYNRKIKNRKFKEAFMNKKLYFGSNFKMYKNTSQDIGGLNRNAAFPDFGNKQAQYLHF